MSAIGLFCARYDPPLGFGVLTSVFTAVLLPAFFFGALGLLTTLVGMVPGLIRARIWFGLPLGLILLGLTTAAAIFLTGQQTVLVMLAAVAIVVSMAVRIAIRRWSWFGAQMMASFGLASITYLAYGASITYVVSAHFVYLIASTVLLLLELAALGLSVSYLFEILDTLSRSSEPSHPVDANYLPKVAIQVPAYNEPIEVVRETLAALAALDYPDLIVQIVDTTRRTQRTGKRCRRNAKNWGRDFSSCTLRTGPDTRPAHLTKRPDGCRKMSTSSVWSTPTTSSSRTGSAHALAISPIRKSPSYRARRTIAIGLMKLICAGSITATSTSS